MGLMLVLIITLGVAAAATAKRPAKVGRKAEPAVDPAPGELAPDDQLDALLRYGTPADAAKLAQQGVDLTGLGYRPRPGE